MPAICPAGEECFKKTLKDTEDSQLELIENRLPCPGKRPIQSPLLQHRVMSWEKVLKGWVIKNKQKITHISGANYIGTTPRRLNTSESIPLDENLFLPVGRALIWINRIGRWF